MRSPEYVNFFEALHDALLGRVGMTADTLLSSRRVIHGLFTRIADVVVQAGIEVCKEVLGAFTEQKNSADLHVQSRNLIENKRWRK
jgi:hypothetical protein